MRRFFGTSNLHRMDNPRRKHEREIQHNLNLILSSSSSINERLLNALRLILHVVAVGLIVFNNIFDSSLFKLVLNASEWVSDESNNMELSF